MKNLAAHRPDTVVLDRKIIADEFDGTKRLLINSFTRLIASGADPEDLREEIVGITNSLTCLLTLAYVGGILIVHARPVERSGLVAWAPS